MAPLKKKTKQNKKEKNEKVEERDRKKEKTISLKILQKGCFSNVLWNSMKHWILRFLHGISCASEIWCNFVLSC